MLLPFPYAASARDALAAWRFATSFWIKPRRMNPTAAIRMTVTQFVTFQVRITGSAITAVPLSSRGKPRKLKSFSLRPPHSHDRERERRRSGPQRQLRPVHRWPLSKSGPAVPRVQERERRRSAWALAKLSREREPVLREEPFPVLQESLPLR